MASILRFVELFCELFYVRILFLLKALSGLLALDLALPKQYFLRIKTKRNRSLSRFWMAVENMKQLKKVKPDRVKDSAREIYNLFIVPSAKHAVRIDSTIVRNMESHLSDEQDNSAFFEAQVQIYSKMEKKYYRKFIISEEYVQYICQLESALDHFRTQGEKDIMLLNWSDGVEGVDQQVGRI